jgi:hypothetical protein
MKVHSKTTLAMLAAAGFVAAIAVGIAQDVRPLPQPPAGVSVERGKYLVTVMDCSGCHTPFRMGEPDMTRHLSGHPSSLQMPAPPRVNAPWGAVVAETNTAWSGPWGISYTTNLTSDRATGIGMWSDELFIRTIRTGRKGGSGRRLLPPMPWQMYGQLSDDDLKSILAYLKTIPGISNRVPEAAIAPPPAGRGSGQ